MSSTGNVPGVSRASNFPKGVEERRLGAPRLLRWLTRNRVDTRGEGAPPGRRYAVPFSRVWDELRDLAAGRRGWRVVYADETRGLLTAVCRTPLLRFRDDLAVWVELDEDGLTRVEARSRSRVGNGDLGTNRRRIERLLRHLDRRLLEA